MKRQRSTRATGSLGEIFMSRFYTRDRRRMFFDNDTTKQLSRNFERRCDERETAAYSRLDLSVFCVFVWGLFPSGMVDQCNEGDRVWPRDAGNAI